MTTAYCYDPLFLEHNQAGHPESPARLEAVMRHLAATGLLARLTPIPPTPATPARLGRVHQPAYVADLQQFARSGGGNLDPDTYVTPDSYEIACLAAGGVVGLTRAVLAGRVRNGIALVRPPGHHATPARGMGFCLFNNVAVAAQAALDGVGAGARPAPTRILIVDWDVHHGNGTQEVFYELPEVLFFSTHQYPYYPGSGDWRETGAGAGRGYTVNVPLPRGVGDAGFARITDEILTPVAERFRPDLILVSAGYDAHWNDPLAGLQLSLGGYWRLGQALVALADRLCGGRLVVALEGGYHLTVLAHAVSDTCRALLGDPAPGSDPLGPAPRPERAVDEVLGVVKQIHGLA